MLVQSVNAAVIAGFKSGARLMFDDMKSIALMWRKDAERSEMFLNAPDTTNTHKAELRMEINTLHKCAALLEAAIRSAEIRSGG